MLKQLKEEEQGIHEKLAELDALQPYEQVSHISSNKSTILITVINATKNKP